MIKGDSWGYRGGKGECRGVLEGHKGGFQGPKGGFSGCRGGFGGTFRGAA